MEQSESQTTLEAIEQFLDGSCSLFIDSLTKDEKDATTQLENGMLLLEILCLALCLIFYNKSRIGLS